jgi:phosphoglycolate phosphatase
MIGDRAVDISSAKANGLRSVGVLWGFGDLAELQGAGADVILRGTHELGQLGISYETEIEGAIGS